MQEQKILRAVINSHADYDKIIDYIDAKEFSPEGSLILNEIGEYYSVDQGAENVDVEILTARLERRLPNPKHAATCIGIVKSLPDVSGANVVREVLELKAQNKGLELAAAIASGKSSKELSHLVDQYAELLGREDVENPNEEITGLSVAALVEKRLDDKELIQIAPKALNDRLDGGARPGHHILIFAPTEMGKTLFVVNALRHFLRQELRTLYVGNEDPAEDIILRTISSVTGFDKFAIKGDPARAQAALDSAGWGNFTFADLAPGSFPRIQRLIKKYEPKVLILDQLSNIDVKGGKNDSKSGSLEQAAKEARGIAKRFGILVVSVVQAADSATGKIVLGRGDVHNSNIGIPGQVDLMVGIGADEAMEGRGLREITLVKNKISGNHDHFTVKFNPIISRVE
jgi:archaellum biogenesis ATPase FlaH